MPKLSGREDVKIVTFPSKVRPSNTFTITFSIGCQCNLKVVFLDYCSLLYWWQFLFQHSCFIKPRIYWMIIQSINMYKNELTPHSTRWWLVSNINLCCCTINYNLIVNTVHSKILFYFNYTITVELLLRKQKAFRTIVQLQWNIPAV